MDNSLSKCHKCFIFNLQIKYEGKKLLLWKIYHTYIIAVQVQKCQKIEKIILGTFSNYFSKIVEIFFENRRNAAVKRQFLKNIFKIFPKIFFRFFGIFVLISQFCTRGKIFITIAFFLHILFASWKWSIYDT